TWLPGSDAANQIRNVAVDEAERLLAVGQWGSHRVALYDLERRELAAELGYRAEQRGEFQPINVLLDGDRVLVVNIWYPRVIELSRATGAVTRVVDLYDLGLVGNGVQLVGAGLSQRRGRLWIAIAQPGTNLVELDLATLAPGRSVDLDTTFPGSFTYDDVAGRIYLTSFRSAAIEVVDVDAMREVDEIEGTIGARETAVDPERGLLFVMDYLHGRVLFHSLAERRVVRRVAVGPKPGGAVVFDGTLYVNATVGVVAIPLD
ncbi:MAG: hypothetical protein IT373_30355, partial [Polyangiaceae bacterium]|nr:hypothetical protein [Polyangiaceae bacterium]